MRISSLQIFNIANNGMANANQSLIKTQEQLSTGVRVLKPSDDPVASTKILQLTDELSGIKQYNKNIDIAKNNLVLEESTLKSVSNLVLRMKELAVQAGNTATLGPGEYKALASEVDTRMEELMNLLNTQNPGGDFIFGGYKSTTEPFVGNALEGFNYLGDEGQQFIKVANNTSVAASDSGKRLFVDIATVENTVKTYPSTSNTSSPGVNISVGRIVDQQAFDEFYPEDMVVTFNPDNFVSPAAKNFNVTERSTGKVIAANQPYLSGSTIELKGVAVTITGEPTPGAPATPATRDFNVDALQALPIDFTATPETFNVTVYGRTESFTLDGPITNNTELATMLNSTTNGNAAALARLNISVDDTGFSMPRGINFTVSGGSANTDAALGLNSSTQSTATDGVRHTAGDRLFIDSSNKQDILSTLAQFSESMKSFDTSQESRDSLEGIVATTIANLGNIQTSVLNVTSELGARFNSLESTSALHLDSELITTEVLSSLRDIDYAEAATRLSAQSLVLQAAQSSFVRVSQLTLFNQL